MAIRYKINPIGKTNGSQQKGPTCWYYAAKMLMNFHDRLEDKADEIYEQWKILDEIRKVMTEADKDLGYVDVEEAITKRAKQNGLVHVGNLLEDFLKELKSDGSNRTQAVAQVAAAKNIGSSQRSQKALMMLYGKIDAHLTRLNLLAEFVPNAGFAIYTGAIDSASDLEKLLIVKGPILVGGAVSTEIKTVEHTVTVLRQSDHTMKMSYKMDMKGSYPNHILVVNGVRGTAVYCVDPNDSNLQKEVPFDIVKQKMQEIITMECKSCVHIKTKLVMETAMN